MCARLLSCPLCSQPGFVTLDALRAGLVSVATRPLVCPVCNETLLGMDKLTIHLFGHTITSNDRSDARTSTDLNSNNSASHGAPNDSMMTPRSWNASSGDAPLLRERNQNGETTNEKLAFLPLSNLNSARTVTAIVINKNSDSPAAVESQSYIAAPESVEKIQDRIIFVSNLNPQQQQFCSIRSNESRSANIRETYETSASMMYHNSAESKNVPLVPAAQSRTKDISAQTSPVDCIGAYQNTALGAASNIKDAAEKDEGSEQLTDTWIENLLKESSDKCDTCCTESSKDDGKSYSCNGLSRLAGEGEKYSDYPRSNLLERKDGERESKLESETLVVRDNAEVFNGNHGSSAISIDVLPQLKTLRLLAVKDKTERCNICGIPVPDRNILNLHKQVVHMIGEKDANGTSEELLKSYPCHFCTKIFKNRGSLMVHMRIAHIGYNFGLDRECSSKGKDAEANCCENGYNCPTCGKSFKKEQHVTQHLKTHEGKQWECDVCSKMFTTKYFLKKHKRLHSGEMPYKCTLCEKTFTFQQSYHKHRLYHKDDKPHTCATCGRSFKELSTLHNHERIHTGEKPFVCETCGKCFRQRVSYLVHRRIHTGVMPYKCVACGKNFRYKVSQRTHKCPAQAEDSVQAIPEVRSTSTVAQSSLCGESSSAVAKSDIFARNETIPEISTTENKFILVVNKDGQPVLTRESELRGDIPNKRENTESLGNRKIDRDGSRDLWHNLPNAKAAKEAKASSQIVEERTRIREKLSANDADDFFSLVMSPLDNDLSSPSAEMKHLRLSSPGNGETTNDSSEILKNDDTNVLQNDLNNAIEGIFRSGNPLETINEESLKQLLYGIDRKV